MESMRQEIRMTGWTGRTKPDGMPSNLAGLLHAPQVQLDLKAREPEPAIREIGELLRLHPGVIDVEALCAEVLAREKVCSTAHARGFALPHARTKLVREIVLGVGRSREGVFFPGAPAPVRLIFLIGTPPEAIGEYLGVVSTLVRRLKDETLCQFLLEAESVEEFADILN